jgi:hypothetical protein
MIRTTNGNLHVHITQVIVVVLLVVRPLLVFSVDGLVDLVFGGGLGVFVVFGSHLAILVN